MSDDMRDEVPIPHFEEDLWQTLAEVHAQQRRDRTAGPVSAPPEVVALRARRRARRTFLAGVGSIAAAAAVLVAVVVTDSDEAGEPLTEAADETTTTTVPTAPEMSLAAQITAATEEASANSIIHTMRDNLYDADDGTPIGDDEDWVDEQSGSFRGLSYDSEGQPSFDSGPAVAPTVNDPGPPPIPPGAAPFDPSLPRRLYRQVDYCFAEYAEFDQTALPGHNEAERIGEWLDEGKLVEDGTEVIDGRELIRLVEVPVGLVPPQPGGGSPTSTVPEIVPWSGFAGATTTTVPAGSPPTVTVSATTEPGSPPPTTQLDPDTFEFVEHIYLVDAETFRPVKIIGYPGEAPDYSDAMYIATIEYLPRTPENLALLSPPIPDGFELVANLRGDGERYDRCGW